ncbi:Brp/Blh family beta-carotene 15,15'-dioxygenase [Lunatimonas salinarum]|uniref:Brp/Blh family beta-carotene 15,15'-dioxygenase n=1 Tax=Lunatimonas salinarum TaxID=1774590 RepID=UPI001ADFAAFA|nr:Brp/Blh family beta-carotene 15,15'-dioxygenase [Lunatimonas salinarum]
MKNTDIWGKVVGFIIAGLYLVFFEGNQTFEWILFALVLFTVGIPHGALDHLLANPHIQRRDLTRFILKYLGIIILYLFIWTMIPVLALFAFLIMSAYHFGQSHYLRERLLIGKGFCYLGTGAFYLGAILLGNFEQTETILSPIVAIGRFYDVGLLLLGTSVVAVAFLLRKNKQIHYHIYLAEMLTLGTLLFHLPLLVGFILYFGFWHALPSMAEEYQSLKFSLGDNRLSQFFLRMLPFTAVSIIGMGIILVILYPTNTTQELTLLFFVLVSLISAPHIWYMNGFLESR